MIPNPWVIIGVTLAFLSSIAGSYLKGYSNGENHEQALWVKKQNKELVEANMRILELTEQARAKESLHAVKLNSISTHYQQELQTHAAEKDRLIVNLKSHTLILRDPASNLQTNRDKASSTPASPSGCDGAAPSGLSATLGEFLIDLASEADTVANQLAACQQIIAEDRNTN